MEDRCVSIHDALAAWLFQEVGVSDAIVTIPEFLHNLVIDASKAACSLAGINYEVVKKLWNCNDGIRHTHLLEEPRS